MKTRLPALAAALLLAVPAASRADDLLDAVLWDGPSAFPSRSAPAPEPPPPPAESEPDPAPVYPSRSSYTLRPSSPTPVPSSPPVPSVPSAPAPAASDPVSLSGETQIRREIQEMRARADRLEAALGPVALPPEPATNAPPSWGLSVRGGVGSDGVYTAHAELLRCVGTTPFDLSLRGFFLNLEYENRDDDGSNGGSHYYSGHMAEDHHLGADLQCIWRPFRNAHFSPHAGGGIRYEDLDDDDEGSGFSLSGRIGAVFSLPQFERLSLKGEFIVGAESRELVGEVVLRLWKHLSLAFFAENFHVDRDHGTAFGGGITLLF